MTDATTQTIAVGDITVDVRKKNIKNVHLSVYPPTGRVRISAPEHMSLDTIRVFAISKLGWIKQQQRKIQGQARETPREYIDRESHYVWGKRYLLQIAEQEAAPAVFLQHHTLCLQIRPETDETRKAAILDEWYRQQLKKAVPALIAKWEPLMDVKVANVFIQQMKTRWGSCNSATRSIRLNSELAKKPRECLEYILVHEMVHLLEPTHNQRFLTLLTQYMPEWQFYRDRLNQLPVRHESWDY
jgi:predicted metal-dependent hydrolase